MRARQFVASGDYYWNSGMFVFKARRYLEELDKFAPDILEACAAAFAGGQARSGFHAHRQGGIREMPQRFDRLCGHGEDRRCGGAAARCRLERRRLLGFAVRRRCGRRSRAMPSRRCAGATTRTIATCYSTSRLVATVGLDDHVVVETKDAVLVAPKERVQDVKKLVARLKTSGRCESLAASRGVSALGQLRQHRQRRALSGQAPVGQAGRGAVAADAPPSRRALDRGAGHRAHHAATTKTFCWRRTNPPTFRSARSIASRIPARCPLHIIEVQSGSYLGEDDIVRFEDNYGRQGTNT